MAKSTEEGAKSKKGKKVGFTPRRVAWGDYMTNKSHKLLKQFHNLGAALLTPFFASTALLLPFPFCKLIIALPPTDSEEGTNPYDNSTRQLSNIFESITVWVNGYTEVILLAPAH